MDMNNTAAQNKSKTTPAAWIAVVLLSFFTAVNAADSSLDRVVALVNTDIVLNSEVQQLALRLKASGTAKTDTNVLLQQALESLISEKLQLQAAKRAGINPNDSSIDRAVNSVAKRNNLSLEQFKQALSKQGINYQGFRETIASQLTINSLKQRRSSQNSEVTDQEVDDLITAESKQITANLSYHIQEILISAPKSIDLTSFNQAKLNAYNVRTLAIRNQDFMQVKLGNSSARDLGWQTAKSLSFVYLAELTKLEPGQVSGVISDANGFHVIKLIKQRGGSQLKSQQVRVRHILVAEGQPNARTRINSLRQQIVQGADFGNMAKVNSDDIGSAINAGDLGWSDSKRYVTEFSKSAETLPLKTLSPVIQTKFGYHILEVIDRREIDASRSALETQARKLILSKKQEQDFDTWVQGLRSSAFVEYKKP